MLNREPLVQSNYDTALKNVTNLRGEVDPEEDRYNQNSQSIDQMNFVVPQYQLVQEPMLPSFFAAIFDVSPAILDVFFSAIFDVLFGYF